MRDDGERFLQRLAAELNGRAPLQARVEHTAGGAAVRVVNPEAGWLAERVNCRRKPLIGDELWFWWEWGQSIGPVDDVPGAAAVVAGMLNPVPRET